jgi:hypothetical protein
MPLARTAPSPTSPTQNLEHQGKLADGFMWSYPPRPRATISNSKYVTQIREPPRLLGTRLLDNLATMPSNKWSSVVRAAVQSFAFAPVIWIVMDAGEGSAPGRWCSDSR